MKNRLILTLILAFVSISISSNAQRKTEAKIKTSAECQLCKEGIEKLVKGMNGVKKATVDLATKELTVVFITKKITLDEIRKNIAMSGWDADDVKASTRKPTKDNGLVNPHMNEK